MIDTVFPTTPQEVQANRVRFLEALSNEPQDAQCNASLFAGEDDIASDGKEQRCALGVAASLFLGITTYEQAEAYDAEHTFPEMGIYDRLIAILGLDASSDIWELNDTEALAFDEIAFVLKQKWELS